MTDYELSFIIDEADAAYADIDRRRAEYDAVRDDLADAHEQLDAARESLAQTGRDLAAAYAGLDAETDIVRARVAAALEPEPSSRPTSG